jgi:hypothetical protein
LRVARASGGSKSERRRPDDAIDLNDVIEWELVESITLQDVALLEQRMPGFAAAVSMWLATTTFDFE